MKTRVYLANLTLMSIVAVVTVSFIACSDDFIDEQQGGNAIVASQNDQLLEPIGLVYKDFVQNNDVQILNADTTMISISKAYADKMGYSNFVNHPMGIWDKKEHVSYLRRATEQKLVDDHYILKVVPSSIYEVVGDREVKLNTHPYYNVNAGATRAASSGMSEEAAKYVDENNVIHPAAITLYSLPDEREMTRGLSSDYGTYTVEEIYYGEFGGTRGVGSLFSDCWNTVKQAVTTVVDRVDSWTSYDVNCPKTTVGLLHHKSKFEKKAKFVCGSENDSITLKVNCPVEFNLDYTLEIRGHGSIKTGMLPKPDYLETYVDGYFGMNPEMKLGFSKKLEIPKDKQRVKLIEFGSVGVTFMIGVVPVHVTFEPNIHLMFKASVEGSVCVGFNYDFATKFRAGVKYNGNWSGIKNGEIVKNDFTWIKPTAAFEVEAGTGLLFGVDVIVDKVAGPTFAVGPQVKLKAALSYTRWTDDGKWDFKAKATAGVAGEFGAKVKVFGWELADWKYPFEIGQQKTIFEYPKTDK